MLKQRPTETFNATLKRMYDRRIGPENIIVIYRKDDVDFGKAIADYYVNARSIPSSNVLELDLPNTALTQAQTDALQETVRNIIDARLAGSQVRAFVLCGDWYEASTSSLPTFPALIDDFLSMPYNQTWYDELETGFTFIYAPDSLPKINPYFFSDDNRLNRTTVKTETTSNRIDDEGFWAVTRWSANTAVLVDDVVRIDIEPDGYRGLLICDSAGTTGTVEPVASLPSGTDPNLYYTDGTAQWRQHPAKEYLYRPICPPDKTLRIPHDFVSQLAAAEEKPSNLPAANSWNTFDAKTLYPSLDVVSIEKTKISAFFPVTRLTAPAVYPSDSYASRLDLAKAIIDRGITFEQAKHATVPGSQFVEGEATYGPSGIAAITLIRDSSKVDQNKVFWSGMVADVAQAPIWPAILNSNLQAGDTVLQPQLGETFTAVNDVFFHFLATGTYNNNHKLPFAPSEVSYTDGAITLFGRSCGLSRNMPASVDFDSDYTLLESRNDGLVSLPGAGDLANIKYVNQEDTALNVYSLSCSETNTTVQVYQDDGIRLTDAINGTTTITLPTGTIRDHYLHLYNNLPVEWTISMSGCQTPESRGAYALRHGAVVAIGAMMEPFAANNPTPCLITGPLLHGSCLAEALMFYGGRACISQGVTNGMLSTGVIGDPLYRPFGHFESERFA